jgi:hypothetical protein
MRSSFAVRIARRQPSIVCGFTLTVHSIDNLRAKTIAAMN